MTAPTQDYIAGYIAELLTAYEDVTGESHTKIAGDMDITASNYYLYRNGKGNPTRKTINKIITVIQIDHPEVIIKVTEKYLRRIYLECADRGIIGEMPYVPF